jgi:hypothetical protein
VYRNRGITEKEVREENVERLSSCGRARWSTAFLSISFDIQAVLRNTSPVGMAFPHILSVTIIGNL